MAIEIYKDSNIVDVVVAQAKGERIDSSVAESAATLIKDLAKTPSPEHRYQIAQLIGFAVNEITRPQTNLLDQIADVKRTAYGEKAQFKVRQEGIRAFIQAKGATTARSRVANKTVTLDTLSVSARPVVNMIELATNADMTALINDAAYQMELAENQYIYNVLTAGATSWASPYYASGSGVVKATLDGMIRNFVRMSGGAAPTILGDIEPLHALGELTGFTASTGVSQFAANLINEQNAMGFIGVYNGARVVNLINPLIDGTDTPVFDAKHLFILPGGIDAAMRPLKVVFEGDVMSQEQTNIDDKSFEVRLDQFFNAAIVYGDRPYLGVYEDTSV